MEQSRIIQFSQSLNLKFSNFIVYCNKNNVKIIWILISIFILFFSLINLWKYYSFQYNALDLGIINQAFYNTSHGRFFGITIHPHSYLGDHLELFILFLLPFYIIFHHPLALLFLQTIFLGMSAFILYLVVKDKLSKNLSLLIVFAFLASPFVHSVNLYEFHLLPFAIFFLFLIYLFYEKNRFGLFILFLLICLTIREDIALVILMLGILALIQKRSIKWILVPLILGSAWFLMAIKLTGYFSGYGHYKFIKYYGWLGNDYLSIISNFFGHPIMVLGHIFTLHNLAFIIGLFLPFAYLPLLRLKYLIPIALVFLQIIFLSTTGELALGIHYTALLIPFLFISLIYVFKGIFYDEKKSKIFRFLYKEKNIFIAIFLTVTIYSTLVMGPIIPLVKNVINYPKTKQIIELKNSFVKLIPQNSAVASGFDYLPNLSSREKVYSLHYQYLGKKQYSDEKYTLPQDTEYILMDLKDFIYYQFLYEKTEEGSDRVKDFIINNKFGIVKIIDNQIVLQKNYSSNEKIYELNPNSFPSNKQNITLDGKILFSGWKNINSDDAELKYSEIDFQNRKYNILPLSLYWQAQEKMGFNLELSLSLEKDNKIVYEKIYPLAGGLYSTSKWQTDETVKTNYWFLIPDYLKKGQYQLNIELLKLKADVSLSGVRSMVLKISEIEKVGQKINLGQITL